MTDQAEFTNSQPSAIVVEPDIPYVNITKEVSENKMQLAQSALQKNKEIFKPTLMEDVETLSRYLDLYIETKDLDQYKQLIRLTLDLKSISAMYDFPLATQIARLMFLLLESHKLKELHSPKQIATLKLYLSALSRCFDDDDCMDNVSHPVIDAFDDLNRVLQQAPCACLSDSL